MKFILAAAYLTSVIIGQTDPGGLPVSLFTQLGIGGLFFWVWQRADKERKDSQARERETLMAFGERMYAGIEVLKDAVDVVSGKS